MVAPIAAMLAQKPSSAKTPAAKRVRLTRSTRVENPEAAIFSLLAIVVPSSRETTILGAILLTGFLGCAEAIQTRVSRSGAFLIMLPLLLGLVAWGGIWLRDDRLRNLIPLRAPPVRREITAIIPTLFLWYRYGDSNPGPVAENHVS
jgi:hypothetical protein